MLSVNFKWRWPSAALGVALLGHTAACTVQVGLDLHYQASQPQRGNLWVQVQCAPGDAPYRLRVISALFQGRDWPLVLRGAAGNLNVWVRGAGSALGDPLHAGALLSGNQSFSFEVVAPAEQWVPAGNYAALATLILEEP